MEKDNRTLSQQYLGIEGVLCRFLHKGMICFLKNNIHAGTTSIVETGFKPVSTLRGKYYCYWYVSKNQIDTKFLIIRHCFISSISEHIFAWSAE